MTDDLVKRLRDSFVYDQQHYAPDPLVAEAADRIEALTAENERLRELISDTGNHWLALVAVHPVRWEGAIDAAMEAACNEIRRLAALRETHHLIPKDQEPVAYLQEHERGERVLRFQPMDRAAPQFGWTETPLFAPEKRHD